MSMERPGPEPEETPSDLAKDQKAEEKKAETEPLRTSSPVSTAKFEGVRPVGRIKALADNPDWLARVGRERILSPGETPVDPGQDLTKEAAVELYTENEAMLRELESHGIAVPKNEFMVAPVEKTAEGKLVNGVVVVVQKVEGSNLEKIAFDAASAERAKADLDHFYASLAGYYLDKFQKGGKYLSDLRNRQFVYGKVEGDEKPRAYLVDIEPAHKEIGAADETGRDAGNDDSFYRCVRQLATDIRNMEKKLAAGAGASAPRHALEEARAKFGELVDAIPDSDPTKILLGLE